MAMAGSFTITISDLAPLSVDTGRAEIGEILYAVTRSMQRMAASQATSISLTDRNGRVIGTAGWTKNKSS